MRKTSEDHASGGRTAGDDRKARLAERLRANLQQRKAQARARRAGEADQRPDGLAQTQPNRDGEG